MIIPSEGASLQHDEHADKAGVCSGEAISVGGACLQEPLRHTRRPLSVEFSSMPIHLEIFHPDRIVVGVARGEITLAEFGGFVRDLAQAGVMHYRKIIDVTAAKSSTVDKEALLAADAQLRELNRKGPRGPLALVADPNRGELAQTFKALAAEDRPVEVFRSLHEARKWLAKFPVPA